MGSGFGRSRWKDAWRPQPFTTKFRFLPGAYINFEGEEDEYYHYVEHFAVRSGKSFVCSKQYKLEDGLLVPVGGKCLGCEAIDNKDKDVSAVLKHAFNGVSLEWYHWAPVFDRNGKPIILERGDRKGQQYEEKVLCEGRRCKHCEAKLPKVFGKKVHWSLGKGHLDELSGFLVEIDKCCSNCGKGVLYSAALECPHCGHLFVNLLESKMSDAEINRFTAHKKECPGCKAVDYPYIQLECTECKDPKPTSIFDVTLEIKKQGERTQSTIQIPRWYLEPLPLELLEQHKVSLKPFVFKDIFRPDDFDRQAEILRVPNPYKDENAKEHIRDYPQDEASEERPNYR